MSLLITTGATVTFEELITQVLSESFLCTIQKHYTKLSIQYGNEVIDGVNVSQRFVDGLKSILCFSHTSTIHETRTDHYTFGSLEVQLFPYSNNIDSWIEAADAVISHAGTGSILDTLRKHKPLGVVPNTKLMDNHQKQIADEFVAGGYCLQSSPEHIAELSETLLTTKFNLLPQNTSVLGQIIKEELSI